MRVRLTHIDGKLPNLALMRLASWYRSRGDEVVFSRDPRRGLMEGEYDCVYGSAIFMTSHAKVAQFREAWPGAVLGGTGNIIVTFAAVRLTGPARGGRVDREARDEASPTGAIRPG